MTRNKGRITENSSFAIKKCKPISMGGLNHPPFSNYNLQLYIDTCNHLPESRDHRELPIS